MGVIPEDRARRWQTLFRRYGIPSEAGGKVADNQNETQDQAPNPDAIDRVLPDALQKVLPTPKPKRKR